jgi:CHAT domain-containing protein/tetratricopeptide (TPR) repeat protein
MRLAAVLGALIFSILCCCLLPAEEESSKDLLQQYQNAVKSGGSLLQEGNYSQAIKLFQTALGIAQQTMDVKREVYCLMTLGKLSWSAGNVEESEEFYSQALKTAQDFHLRKEESDSLKALRIYELYSLGKADRLARQYEKSLKNFSSAVELARALGSREHELKCLRQLSLVYLEMNDLDLFFSLSQQALEIAQGLNDKRERAKSLINIGLGHLKLNNYSQALSSTYGALEFARAAGNHEDEAVCLKNIALLLMHLGVYEKALDYLLSATEIDRDIGNDFFVSTDMINLGQAFQRKGLIFGNRSDLSRALEYYREALALAIKKNDKKSELNLRNNMGTISLDLGNFEEALTSFQCAYQQAEKPQDREALMHILNNLGVCHFQMGNSEKAQVFLENSIELGNRIGRNKMLWEPYFFLGQCFEKKSAFDQAATSYQDAIDAVDHIRSHIFFDAYKASFVRDKLKTYESLIGLLFRLSRNGLARDSEEKIFSLIERAKARAFLESLGDFKSQMSRRLDSDWKEREAESSRRISALIQEMLKSDFPENKRAGLQKELNQAEDEYLALLARMRTDVPEVADLIAPLPAGLEKAREWLPDEKTAMIEYFLGEKQSFVFFITKNNWFLMPLPPRQGIAGSLKAYLKNLSDPSEREFRGVLAAKRLYRELLSSGLETLPGSIEHLIIIPDDVLYYLPFETLIFDGEVPSGQNDFLISKYSISYAPSFSSLLFLEGRKRKARYSKALLALGNPAYALKESRKTNNIGKIFEIMKESYQAEGFVLSSLAQSEAEIRAISKFPPKGKTDIYLRKNASENLVKKIPLEDYQIIHFACHGFLDEKLPFRSALVLSSTDDSEDGFLQVREIYNLRLAADLVVLSACHTSAGYLERGEGILGLTRIFFYSGARSVLASLWKIHDKASAEFMRRFYFHLSQKNDKAQALRLAKLDMLRSKYSHPFFWAGFVLNGEYSSTLSFD